MTLLKIHEILTAETAQKIKFPKVPKTGLAASMRDWMKARTGNKKQRRFTIAEMCEALNIKEGADHQALAWALSDFIKRKEVSAYQTKSAGRSSGRYTIKHYLYVHDWRKELKGKLNRKIFKAMYVSGDFSATDIKRLTGLDDTNWIHKIIRNLKKEGYLQQISRRLCTHGDGAEIIWHVVNRDKFNLEKLR